jgi:hypothetical protein
MPLTFDSVNDLERALREAAAAHGRHEARTGRPDPEWPVWYAKHMAGTLTPEDDPDPQ